MSPVHIDVDNGYLEGRNWKIRAALSAALSLVPLIALIATTAGNHGSFNRNLLMGILVTAVCFVILAVVAPLRFRATRRVTWSRDGLVVPNFWHTWRVPWAVVEGVTVTVRSRQGPTWFFPTLQIRGGKNRMVAALASVSDGNRAQEAAASLTTVIREHQGTAARPPDGGPG